MTLLFVTAYDIPTLSNLAVAKAIIASTDTALLEENATRPNLLAAVIANPTEPILVMSHGKPEALMDNQAGAAIQSTDGVNISQRVIFAWACHTGSRLGYAMAKADNIWWGYDCAVTAPDDREPYLQIFSDIFLGIKNIFPAAIDESSVLSALDQIQALCASAIEALDACGGPEDIDAFSLYSC